MRKSLLVVCLIVAIGCAVPAQAQLREGTPTQVAPVKIYDDGASAFSLNNLFSPEHFRMGHSYEMSFGRFGGQGQTLGMYTNSLMWQFDHKLAARVDVAFAHTPFGNNALQQINEQGQNAYKIFLRNAEVAYRPTDNIQIHFSYRQSPYGGYMDPYYGGYGAYGYRGMPYYYGGQSAHLRIGTADNDLFWNPRFRR